MKNTPNETNITTAWTVNFRVLLTSGSSTAIVVVAVGETIMSANVATDIVASMALDPLSLGKYSMVPVSLEVRPARFHIAPDRISAYLRSYDRMAWSEPAIPKAQVAASISPLTGHVPMAGWMSQYFSPSPNTRSTGAYAPSRRAPIPTTPTTNRDVMSPDVRRLYSRLPLSFEGQKADLVRCPQSSRTSII